MSQLTYEDYKERVDIKDLLEYAGYRFNRRDGLRYPTFVRTDSLGKHIKGDKFIVTANGKCCFKPPEQRNYNVISFIKEHADLFPEYSYGMDKDKLVNMVCRKILGQPLETEWSQVQEAQKDVKFSLDDYEIVHYDRSDKENVKLFFPYFKQRGIDLLTQAAFADSVCLSTNIRRKDGKRFTNIAFPFRTPSSDTVVGLEVRSVKHSDGTSFKGKALGTDSVDGLWIASPNHTVLDKARDVLWFESAYDAMAFYQIMRKSAYDEKNLVRQEMDEGMISKGEAEQRLNDLDGLLSRFKDAVYLSTGGSPSDQQFKGVLKVTPEARHLLAFDNDKAGKMYCFNFLMNKENRFFNSYTSPDGHLVFIDRTRPAQSERYDFNPSTVTVEEFCDRLGLKPENVGRMAPSPGYKDWNDQLLDKPMKEEEEQVQEENEGVRQHKGLHR